jgi:hypothetical protein
MVQNESFNRKMWRPSFAVHGGAQAAAGEQHITVDVHTL